MQTKKTPINWPSVCTKIEVAGQLKVYVPWKREDAGKGPSRKRSAQGGPSAIWEEKIENRKSE